MGHDVGIQSFVDQLDAIVIEFGTPSFIQIIRSVVIEGLASIMSLHRFVDVLERAPTRLDSVFAAEPFEETERMGQ